MATPIRQEAPPMPLSTGARIPDAPAHPGFYKGDDPVEWARNRLAIIRYQCASMRAGAYVDSPAIQARLEHLDAEGRMFDGLLKRVR